MKFDLYCSPERKAFMLPETALKLAGLNAEEKLNAHVAPGTVAILKENMNAREMAAAIGSLSALAVDMTVKLALACGDCEYCGLCGNCGLCGDRYSSCDDYDDCEDCEEDCSGLEIPPCLLAQAGIGPYTGLDVEIDGDKVVVKAAKRKSDPLDSMPEILMYTFTKSGYCLSNLRLLLESGEIIDE